MVNQNDEGGGCGGGEIYPKGKTGEYADTSAYGVCFSKLKDIEKCGKIKISNSRGENNGHNQNVIAGVKSKRK